MRILVRSVAAIALAVGLTASGSIAASAQPAYNSPVTNPYQPGAAGKKQYRRSMHRYRHHPGARQQLRTNRLIYCRDRPSRC